MATLFARYALTHADDIPFTLNWPITNILLWCCVIEGLITLLILLTVDAIVPSWIFNRSKKCKKSVTQTHYQPNLTNMTDVNMTLTTSDAKPKNFSRQIQLPQHQFLQQYQLNNNRNTTGAGLMLQSSGLSISQPQQVDFKTNKFPITNGSLFASLTAAAATNQHQKGSKPTLSRGILQQLVDNNTGTNATNLTNNMISKQTFSTILILQFHFCMLF